jgi:hypothetical protein
MNFTPCNYLFAFRFVFDLAFRPVHIDCTGNLTFMNPLFCNGLYLYSYRICCISEQKANLIYSVTFIEFVSAGAVKRAQDFDGVVYACVDCGD